MGLTDNIAAFLMEMLEESTGELEVQRQELAQRFGVVPSQINYVLASRFRPEQGYRIESRRGGGGYIRIYRVQDDSAGRIMHLVNAIGESLDAETASQHLKNLLAYDILTGEQCRLMAAALSERALAPLARKDRNIIRARLFKNMLVSTIS
jgi:transcriptional regulator CtsR